jgi:hypothetical protein
MFLRCSGGFAWHSGTRDIVIPVFPLADSLLCFSP